MKFYRDPYLTGMLIRKKIYFPNFKSIAQIMRQKNMLKNKFIMKQYVFVVWDKITELRSGSISDGNQDLKRKL